MADLSELESDYVFQYLEDHIPCAGPLQGPALLEEIKASEIDVLQYSWFQTYADMRGSIEASGAKAQYLCYTDIVSKRIGSFGASSYVPYAVGLTSVFEHGFLHKLLSSTRPYQRKFPASSPFDLEQEPKNTWSAPFRFALPKHEVGLCIDDDHRVEGSSAISRGIFPVKDYERESQHYGQVSLRGVASLLSQRPNVRSQSKSPSLRSVVSGHLWRVVSAGDRILYSAIAALVEPLEKFKAKLLPDQWNHLE